MSNWHLGCKYFVGQHVASAKKVLVKTGGWLGLAEREVRALDIVHNKGRQRAPFSAGFYIYYGRWEFLRGL